MGSILISPDNEPEYAFVMEFLKRAHIKATVLGDEDKEDLALLKAMMETEGEEYVVEENIMKALRRDESSL